MFKLFLVLVRVGGVVIFGGAYLYNVGVIDTIHGNLHLGDRPARGRPGPVLHGGRACRGARGDGSGHGRGIGVSTDRAAKAR